MDLNRIMLIGNLTRDPENRHLQSGSQVTKFDIAVNDRSRGRDNQETMFIRVETWNKTAEIASQYLRKGSMVLVEGRLKIEEYETKDGQKRRDPLVVADRISLGPRPGGAGGASREEGEGYGARRDDYAPRREETAPRQQQYTERRPQNDQPRGAYGDVEPIGDAGAGTDDDLPF